MSASSCASGSEPGTIRSDRRALTSWGSFQRCQWTTSDMSRPTATTETHATSIGW
jgi:hypothetical protein